VRLEDYGLVGDTQTAALIGIDGSVDWLCLPRFDSSACFAALLGEERHGRWLLAPAGGVRKQQHRYRRDTLVLETEWETDDGVVRVLDFMPPRHHAPDLVRIVEGVSGRVPMRTELVVRYDYGSVVPWVQSAEHGLTAVAGPDALALHTSAPIHGEDLRTVADFSVAQGERVPFTLTWYPSHEPRPDPVDPERALTDTEAWWQDWAGRCTYEGRWREPVMRSLIVLKALTYAPTGGIVAAATTSLPEQLGGVRNWDYRYCWVRDATLTLNALLSGGYVDEARAWRDWLLRAAAGQPEALRIMYGPAGERRLPETVLPWLPGYEDSAPVRVGNAAVGQLQLDVFGELMDALHQARGAGLEPEPAAWDLQRAFLDHLEGVWHEPDEGLWEVRGAPRKFTHSKVMAWVAFDRAIKAIEDCGLEGPVDRWRRRRAEIHDEVCREAYDADRRTFTQSYGSAALDASCLMIPLVGFLPPGDERVRGTVAAIERELSAHGGFVSRYDSELSRDGLPAGEGAFLACSFWLADNLALQGRREEAKRLFERLLRVRTGLGLLAEEYDVHARRLVGNFPQAFSHVGLVNSAAILDRAARASPASP